MKNPKLKDSRFHGHQIVPWAVEEECYFCHYPASHKVTEEYVPPPPQGFNMHPYTAYVCCNHFWAGCRNSVPPEMRYDNGHTYDRT